MPCTACWTCVQHTAGTLKSRDLTPVILVRKKAFLFQRFILCCWPILYIRCHSSNCLIELMCAAFWHQTKWKKKHLSAIVLSSKFANNSLFQSVYCFAFYSVETTFYIVTSVKIISFKNSDCVIISFVNCLIWSLYVDYSFAQHIAHIFSFFRKNN